MQIHIKDLQIQDMLIQNQLITLVKELNAEQNTAAELTDNMLYTIFCIYKNTKYLSHLYKLIFYSYKQKPELAYSILRGFVLFGQSESGAKYKPLMDYLVIEAFNGLLNMGGWTIIKPCVIQMRSTIYNFSNEPLFKHIIERVIIQLKTDMKDISYSSDICYHLPREKSFVWGWFSHTVARTYFSDPKYNMKRGKGEKKMRKYMMLYRKLITHLRQNTLEMAPVYDAHAPEKMEESWNGVLKTLETENYAWVATIIDRCLYSGSANDVAVAQAPAAQDEEAPAQDEVEAPAPAQAIADEQDEEAPAQAIADEQDEEAPAQAAAIADEQAPAANEVQAQAIAVEVEAPAQAPAANEVAPADEVAPVKNSGWLYSLFGWA